MVRGRSRMTKTIGQTQCLNRWGRTSRSSHSSRRKKAWEIPAGRPAVSVRGIPTPMLTMFPAEVPSASSWYGAVQLGAVSVSSHCMEATTKPTPRDEVGRSLLDGRKLKRAFPRMPNTRSVVTSSPFTVTLPPLIRVALGRVGVVDVGAELEGRRARGPEVEDPGAEPEAQVHVRPHAASYPEGSSAASGALSGSRGNGHQDAGRENQSDTGRGRVHGGSTGRGSWIADGIPLLPVR